MKVIKSVFEGVSGRQGVRGGRAYLVYSGSPSCGLRVHTTSRTLVGARPTCLSDGTVQYSIVMKL